MTATTVPEALVDELLEVALEAATGAAQLVEQYSAVELEEVTTKSSPTDLVSEADRASEAYIFAALRRARPLDSVQGEEGIHPRGHVRSVVGSRSPRRDHELLLRDPGLLGLYRGSCGRSARRRRGRRPVEERDLVRSSRKGRLVQRHCVPRRQRPERPFDCAGGHRVQLQP